MKIGVFAMLSEKTLDPISVARRCEELGFESIWVPEHAIIPVHLYELGGCFGDYCEAQEVAAHQE